MFFAFKCDIMEGRVAPDRTRGTRNHWTEEVISMADKQPQKKPEKKPEKKPKTKK
jgi:hypothetical protein